MSMPTTRTTESELDQATTTRMRYLWREMPTDIGINQHTMRDKIVGWRLSDDVAIDVSGKLWVLKVGPSQHDDWLLFEPAPKPDLEHYPANYRWWIDQIKLEP